MKSGITAGDTHEETWNLTGDEAMQFDADEEAIIRHRIAEVISHLLGTGYRYTLESGFRQMSHLRVNDPLTTTFIVEEVDEHRVRFHVYIKVQKLNYAVAEGYVTVRDI